MTDDLTPAPEAGNDEVVQPEAEQVEAAEAPESTEGQEETQPAEAEPEGEAEEKKSKSAERRERRKAEMERLRQSEAEATARAREAAERLKAAREAAKALTPPKQADYQDFEEYQAALSSFKTLAALDEREAKRLEAQAEQERQAVEAARRARQIEAAQNWNAAIAEGRERYQDFEAVVLSESVPFTPQVADVVRQSDAAADVAYHLAKNTDLLRQMAGMDAVTMARTVGRIEAQLEAMQTQTETKAPAPIKPVKPSGAAVKDPAKMTMAEYMAARKAGKI